MIFSLPCRFTAWFGDAVLAQAPDHAPWRRWKQEAQQSAVAELLGPQCARDARRFKRVRQAHHCSARPPESPRQLAVMSTHQPPYHAQMLKVLCGGKKKGQHLDQPARVGS